MQIFLVGGAVRDELLDREPVERDWVVVGATPRELLDRGYRQVGKDFPVFLHPDTAEEYALARTERKRGHGYTGFEVHCASDVTLEEDLARRDLTVNAMARDDAGAIIDPYGGQQDLAARLLRHVSPAFVEDPLRVLRVARFAARYAALGFRVAKETINLMTEIVASGELDHLAKERIWTETQRALSEPNPEVYIQVLRDCGALAALLPEVERLFGVPQVAEHHPEIDTGLHTLLALQAAVKLGGDDAVRFAVLLHDLGKGLTPESEWPRHIAHEHRGVAAIRAVCKRFAVPKRHQTLAERVGEYHTHCHRALELRGKTLMKLLTAVDALRRPQQFEDFLIACEADARGRTGFEERDYPQADYLRRALIVVESVKAAELAEEGYKGKALGEALTKRRIAALEQLRPGK